MDSIVIDYLDMLKKGDGKVLPSEAASIVAKKYGLRNASDVLVKVMNYFIIKKSKEGIIQHKYKNASENAAQYEADQIDRQEVSISWYLENMSNYPFFRWIPNHIEYGLDPWQFYMDFPISQEQAELQSWRIFVQKKDLFAWQAKHSEIDYGQV
jgi:hypothetical protein